MKVLFIGKYYYFEIIPIMYLSGYLKKHGHECYYLDLKLERNIIEKVKNISPSVIAYNMITGLGDSLIKLNSKLKDNFNFFSVFGGTHCTLFPELVYQKDIDAVCRGEGEIAFLELINALESNSEIRYIKNFWIKFNGDI